MGSKKKLRKAICAINERLDRLEEAIGSKSTQTEGDADAGGACPEAAHLCSAPEPIEPVFDDDVTTERANLVRIVSKKWVNGTELKYYFFDKDTDGRNVTMSDGSRQWRSWKGASDQRDVVEAAFQTWKDLGIGLKFTKVSDRNDADIRIGFQQGDGAWSYLGRDIRTIGRNERTMNFGWSLTGTDGADTALHEIGHTLGFPHEHQNPNAGLVWDEDAVYRSLAGPPNRWSRDKTFHNIIRKLPATTVDGSNWDPNSIMHYPFEARLIK